jgi:hypothetical protein
MWINVTGVKLGQNSNLMQDQGFFIRCNFKFYYKFKLTDYGITELKWWDRKQLRNKNPVWNLRCDSQVSDHKVNISQTYLVPETGHWNAQQFQS